MLVLRRNYQFWFIMMGLNKLGAVAILATDQLLQKDFEYRFRAAGVSAIVCTNDSLAWQQAELAMENYDGLSIRIMVNGAEAGWHDFDAEYQMFRSSFERSEDSACGKDTMLMFFTSGTSGYPKIAAHNYQYPLGHFVTARYWQCVDPEGLHLTISDTGWAKAMWGKLYGQWLNEAAVFVYDFERFDAHDILPMFAKYHITTFCAPPTMYRFMIKEDIAQYDLSSVQHATTAGEALNPEVFHQFKKATGVSVLEGFGQSETTVMIGNLNGMTPPHRLHGPTDQRAVSGGAAGTARAVRPNRAKPARSASAPPRAAPAASSPAITGIRSKLRLPGMTAIIIPATPPGGTRTATFGTWAAPTI